MGHVTSSHGSSSTIGMRDGTNRVELCDKEGTMSMFREDHYGNAQVVHEHCH
jgi:hypothetical protein